MLEIFKTRLENDSILHDYNKNNDTNLESGDVVQLLDFYLDNYLFHF